MGKHVHFGCLFVRVGESARTHLRTAMTVLVIPTKQISDRFCLKHYVVTSVGQHMEEELCMFN
jgi:hypothetical protein